MKNSKLHYIKANNLPDVKTDDKTMKNSTNVFENIVLDFRCVEYFTK